MVSHLLAQWRAAASHYQPGDRVYGYGSVTNPDSFHAFRQYVTILKVNPATYLVENTQGEQWRVPHSWVEDFTPEDEIEVYGILGPPLYRSGLEVGQHVFIDHPEIGQPVGGEVTGEVPVSGLVMVRMDGTDLIAPVPLEMIRVGGMIMGLKMFHVAPGSARNSIEQQGLDYSLSGRGAPVSGNGSQLPGGNYLYRDRRSAEDLLANVSGAFDLWEVEVDGLTLLDDPYEDYEAVYTIDPIPPSRLRRVTASTWRGFTQEDAPPWKMADFVILTQRRGRQRYYEVFTFGRNWRNFERLEEAKAAVEADHGPLVWRQKSMHKVWVEHYWFGWTTEFTDPLTIYLADL